MRNFDYCAKGIIMLISTVVFSGCGGDLQKTASTDADTIRIGGTALYSPTLQSRLISAENKTGAKGQGGQAVGGRKGSPCLVNLKKDQVYTFAEIEGPGVIRNIWITVEDQGPEKMRNLILRFYWDDQENPSVEVPLTDFFGIAHGKVVPYESAFISTAEGRAFNCFFPMPFSKKAKLTICNEWGQDAGFFFYQVSYTTGDAIYQDTPYFHAQFRRTLNTTLGKDYVILDGVQGKGRFLGASIGIVDRFHGKSWWGEGEVKMYIDGDKDFPTICGTGTEDYVGSGWGLGQFYNQYFGAPYIQDKYISFYRFHVVDPIYFSEDIKVTLQMIGYDWNDPKNGLEGPMKEFIEKGEYKYANRPEPFHKYFELVNDVCSTAYWYQTLPTVPFPALPDKATRCADLPE